LRIIEDEINLEETSEEIVDYINDQVNFSDYREKYVLHEHIDEIISNALQHSGIRCASVFGQSYLQKREVIVLWAMWISKR